MKTFKEKLHIGLNQEIKIKNRLINKKSNFLGEITVSRIRT